MKYFIKVFSILFCVLGLVGCRPDGTTDTPELEEITRFTQEQLDEKLIGLPHEEIFHSWGEADIQFSGFWGHSWYLDDSKDKYISAYYDEKGYIKEIVIGSRLNENISTILDNITVEGITSARFDSTDPNFMYEIKDLTIITELLTTLNNAIYEVCKKPKEPWFSIEAIYITTKENEYYIGVIENSAFRITVNGEGEYYTCSNKNDFLNKLLELQGR